MSPVVWPNAPQFRARPNPCSSCPYRRDVPSAIWHRSEYEKLASYDLDTGYQPTRVFMCHNNPDPSTAEEVCRGWSDCHGADNLLGLRIALARGQIEPETYWALAKPSGVPVFESGTAAAAHGMARYNDPSERSMKVARQIVKKHSPIRELPRG